MFESTNATFKRIYELTGIDFKSKNKATLNNILRKKLNTNKLPKNFYNMFNIHLLNYNYNWKKLDSMNKILFSKKFRSKYKDDFNKEWIFSWHCVDHVNYLKNPRKRELGYGKLSKYYEKQIKKSKVKDDIFFHYHPMPFSKEAHRNSNRYFYTENLNEIISRKIIDQNWFPVCNRAGFHTERPDSHWFLEQYIPFDLSNIRKKGERDQNKPEHAQFWDWRRAPNDWEIYHPHHDDYQIKGNCRRWIGRVLNIKNRVESLDKKEVLKAFKRANDGKKTLLAATGHDFRNLESEVEEFHKLIMYAKKKYPNVKISYETTLNGFRKALSLKINKEKKIKLKITKLSRNSYKIKTVQGKVFGPQPFLAIKLKNGRYYHDNLDFGLTKGEWFYTFSEHNFPKKNVNILAIGAADKFGNFHTCKIKI